MRRVALVLEGELYKLRDQVVQLGDEVGAEVEKLRGQVLEQEEQRKDPEDELEYSESSKVQDLGISPSSSLPSSAPMESSAHIEAETHLGTSEAETHLGTSEAEMPLGISEVETHLGTS